MSVLNHASDIIREASRSPRGIVAISILAITVTVYLLFRKSVEKVKLSVFLALILTILILVLVVWYPRENAIIGDKQGSKRADGNDIVTGVVVEERTDQGVTQAQVSISGRPNQTTTDDAGNFVLFLKSSRILETLELHVSKQGYRDYTMTIVPPVKSIKVPLSRDP
jgi:Ca2+/Na+ antiporter